MSDEDDKVTTEIFSPTTPPPRPPTRLPTTTKPPLIYHITAASGTSRTTTLQTFLTTHTPLQGSLIRDLADLGSIYLHHTPGPRVSEKPVRQTRQALQAVLPGGRLYARVHAHPKRYTGVYAPFVMWEEGGVVAVNKPPGLPVAAGVDNCRECVTALLGLRVTTRLDVGTSGVLVMGRGGGDVARGNRLVGGGIKVYVVVVDGGDGGGLGRGVWKDWYRRKPALGRGDRPAALRRWEAGPEDGWVEARLEVLDHRELRDGGYVVVVRLRTGRTHQIRLQFCARGWVVRGDGKYRGIAGRVYDGGVLGADAVVLGLHAWLLRTAEFPWVQAGWHGRSDFEGWFQGGVVQWLDGVAVRLRSVLGV